MILHCNFEELRALTSGAEILSMEGAMLADSAVAAPAEGIAQVEMIRARLTGDLTVSTLAEQRQIRGAVAVICGELRTRLDEKILTLHPAHEEAVAMYFDYAHSRGVLDRLDRMGAEMEAIVELITGEPATDETAASFSFVD